MNSAGSPKEHERLLALHARIEEACHNAGRERGEVSVIAVSKRQPTSAIEVIATHGMVDFGENQIQAWRERQTQLPNLDLRWHILGPLQSRKAKSIAEGQPHLVHTIDRPRIVASLTTHWRHPNPLPVLAQVNIDREPQKSGVDPDALDALVDLICQSPALCFRGVMSIPQPRPIPDMHRAFAATRQCLSQVADRTSGVPILSMGMSRDYGAAIAEGSTMVRIGTALFGPRQ